MHCILVGCNRLHWFAGCPLILYHKQIQQWRTAPSEAFTAGYPWNAADKNQMPKNQRYDDRDDDARPKVEIWDLSELVARKILCGLRIAKCNFWGRLRLKLKYQYTRQYNHSTPHPLFAQDDRPCKSHLYWRPSSVLNLFFDLKVKHVRSLES